MTTPKNKGLFLCLFLLAAAGIWMIQAPTVAAPRKQDLISLGGATMGTTYQVQLAGEKLAAAERTALQVLLDRELEAVNAAMSTYLPDSEISRFNRLEAWELFPVSDRFREVLVRSFEIFRLSGGSFDPTLGPLIDLWGFGAAGRTAAGPSEEEIAAARTRVGMDHLQLNREGMTKGTGGVEINLSAIAKGYGVDRLAALLREKGFQNFYVEIGGELYCSGRKADGSDWRIGIQVPAMEASFKAMEVVRLQESALATSGDYRNYVADENGIRHHILDPRTGRPAKHTLASVSVLAGDCMTADAVATALFVMGTEEGMTWIQGQEGMEALFIDREGDRYRITATAGFQNAMIRVP